MLKRVNKQECMDICCFGNEERIPETTRRLLDHGHPVRFRGQAGMPALQKERTGWPRSKQTQKI